MILQILRKNKAKRYREKYQKKDPIENLNTLYEGREMTLNVFSSRIFTL